MLVISPERAYGMTEGQCVGLLKIVAELVPEGTLYAVEKGGTVQLVKERDERRIEEYRADGYRLHIA